VTAEQAREATGWDLKLAPDLNETEPPSDEELSVLRELTSALEQAA
jgi:glutaconate CoA-transferase subunit B